MKEKNQTFLCLDLLRIIAMFMILGVHITQHYSFPGAVLFSCGSGGVYIFFCLSGFLAFLSLDKGISYTKYIKKRLLKIIPSYYLLLILVIFWRLYGPLGNMPEDAWKLGWIRYFLCLQTVVPSNHFEWNNSYGLWTISCFVFFYIMAPVLKKYIINMKRAIGGILILMFLCEVVQSIARIVFSYIPIAIEKPDVLVGSSPINNLYAFMFGIMAYYMVKQKDKSIGIFFSSIILLISCMISNEKLLWCIIAVLFIAGGKDIHIKLNVRWERFIRFISNISFQVYLIHMLVIEMVNSVSITKNINSNIQLAIVLIGIIIGAFGLYLFDLFVKKLVTIKEH